ncbi:MAG: hypothetical protein ACJ76P_05395 [Actinomycetota bacterium]
MRIGPPKRVIEVDPVEEPVPGLLPEEPLPAPPTSPEPPAPDIPSEPERAPEPEKEPAGSLSRDRGAVART